WAALLVGGSLAHHRVVLAAFIVATFAVGGLVDTVMNVAATAALAPRPGALVRFHALFNIGGAIGALGRGLLILNGASWRWGGAVVGGRRRGRAGDRVGVPPRDAARGRAGRGCAARCRLPVAAGRAPRGGGGRVRGRRDGRRRDRPLGRPLPAHPPAVGAAHR